MAEVLASASPASARGITGFGAYVPRLRIPRSVIADAHRWMAPGGRGRGRKAFCNWDEDALTMAVDAGRAALADRRHPIDAIVLASTSMPNDDLQHSAVAATVLDLPAEIRSIDPGCSQRAGTSALIAALAATGEGTLLLASDRPLAKPASPQEQLYGAGAAAFTLGSEGVIANLLAAESSAAPLVDHFRRRGSDFDYYWEERWIREEGFAKLVSATVDRALDSCALQLGDIQYLVFGASAANATSLLARNLGFDGKIIDPLGEDCGFAGCADPLLGLIGALEQASAGERILVVGFGQGCDALVLEATGQLDHYRPARGLARTLCESVEVDAYLRMLSAQGLYQPDFGMRGEKEVRTALTDLYRSVDQVWKFEAGRCGACGTLQFPQLAYCIACRAPASQFEPERLADKTGHLVTYTADWLTYHPSPPLYAGFVQFGDSARLLMEVTDVGPEGISEGTLVRMAFRIKDFDKSRGWTRYFWKAVPDLDSSEAG